eukprot:6476934-Amphidinium_carterae.2
MQSDDSRGRSPPPDGQGLQALPGMDIDDGRATKRKERDPSFASTTATAAVTANDLEAFAQRIERSIEASTKGLSEKLEGKVKELDQKFQARATKIEGEQQNQKEIIAQLREQIRDLTPPRSGSGAQSSSATTPRANAAARNATMDTLKVGTLQDETKTDTIRIMEQLITKVDEGMAHVQRLWAPNLYNKVGYITCKSEQDMWSLRSKLVASDLKIGERKHWVGIRKVGDEKKRDDWLRGARQTFIENQHLETEDDKKSVRICWSSGKLYWHKEVVGLYSRNTNRFDFVAAHEACSMRLLEYIRKYYG